MALSDFQERKESDKVLFSYLSMLIVSVLVLVVMIGTLRIFKSYSALREEILTIKAEISALELDKIGYESRLNQLKTETGLEKEARSRFNLKKSGEEVVIFTESENEARLGGVSGKLASLFSLFKQWLLRPFLNAINF